MKVLVIEDTDMHRQIIGRILSKFKDVEVYNAEDAFEGYCLLKVLNKVDLVLLDYQMPYVTGDIFIKKVLSEERFKGLRIIVSTGEEDACDFKELGAITVLNKPYQIDDLTAVVETIKSHIEHK